MKLKARAEGQREKGGLMGCAGYLNDGTHSDTEGVEGIAARGSEMTEIYGD